MMVMIIMIGDDGDVDDDGGHDHYNGEDDVDGDIDGDGGDIPLEFLPDCQTTASVSLP